MSSKTGTSIRFVHGQAQGFSVTPLGDQRWSLDTVVTQPSGSPADNLLWIVPEDLAHHSIFSLPPLKGRELKRAVLGWVAREAGGIPEDWDVSWNSLSPLTDNSGKTRNQISALYARGAELKEALAAEPDLTQTPRHALPPSMVLDHFYRHSGNSPCDEAIWNLVFLSKDENFLVISSQESQLLTRGLPNDLSEGAEREQYLDRLATEIQRSSFYIRQGDQSPEVQRIVVTGDPDLAPKLVARLSTDDGTPAHFWDIRDSFDLQDQPIGPEFMISLAAAALPLAPLPFDLMPRAKRTLFSPLIKRRALVGAGALGAALLPILLVGSAVTARIQEDYLEKARVRHGQALFEAEEAAGIYRDHHLMLSRRDHLKSFQANRPDLESILLHLGTMAPQEINFRDLRVSEQADGSRRLVLTGESVAPTSSRAQDAFLEFQDILSRSPYLHGFSEPLELQINGSSKPGHTQRRTVFKMNFEIITDTGERG